MQSPSVRRGQHFHARQVRPRGTQACRAVKLRATQFGCPCHFRYDCIFGTGCRGLHTEDEREFFDGRDLHADRVKALASSHRPELAPLSAHKYRHPSTSASLPPLVSPPTRPVRRRKHRRLRARQRRQRRRHRLQQQQLSRAPDLPTATQQHPELEQLHEQLLMEQQVHVLEQRDSQEALAESQAECNRLAGALRELDQYCREMEDYTDDLKHQLSTSQASAQHRNLEVAQLQQDLSAAHSQCAAADKHIADLTQYMDTHLDRDQLEANHALSSTCNKLLRKIDDLEHQLSMSQSSAQLTISLLQHQLDQLTPQESEI